MILAIFDLQCTLTLSIKLESVGFSIKEKYFQIDCQASKIFDQNDFSYVCPTRLLYFLPSFKSVGLSVQDKKLENKKKKKHVGFLIEMIFAYFLSNKLL